MEKSEKMDPPSDLSSSSSKTNETDVKNGQSMVIIVLCVLLFFSLLGVNLLTLAGNLFQSMFDVIQPVSSTIMSETSYSAGKIIDKTSDVATDVGKTSLDIVNGSFHSVGDLLIKAGEQGRSGRDLDDTINEASKRQKHVDSDSDESPIQQRKNKTQWCLVGEHQYKRGCVEVGEQDKCLSGQVFPSQQMCLNPTLSQNR